MKLKNPISFLILFLFISVTCFSQSIVNRANSSYTVQDARLAAQYNLLTPRFADSTAANLQIVIDSCGAVVYLYSTHTFWYRSCASSTKKWVEIGSGGGGGLLITPSDNPQTVLDNAPAGSKLIFVKGVHEWGFLNSYNSILYVNKPVDIFFEDSAVLKLADSTTVLETGATGEITDNQGVYKTLNDLTMDATENYTGTTVKDYYVQIQGTGSPNTFNWGTYNEATGVFTQIAGSVAITAGAQTLENGVVIRFGSTTGHSAQSIWYISYDGPESYGIRINRGINDTLVENVTITGTGIIDMNRANNVQPSFLVKDISSCILVHGKAKNIYIGGGLKLYGTERTVMAYGESDGTYNWDGTSTGVTQTYDVENLTVSGVYSLNTGRLSRGFLFGHPSHRGSIRNLVVTNNFLSGGNTLIEPNFMLNGYTITNNIILWSGAPTPIHAWRHSQNGLIANNIIKSSPAATSSAAQSSPGGWAVPYNITTANNSLSYGESDLSAAALSDSITYLQPVSYLTANTSYLVNRYRETIANGDMISSLIDATGNKIGAARTSPSITGNYNSTDLSVDIQGAYVMPRSITTDPYRITIALMVKLSNVTTSNVLWSFRNSTTELIQINADAGNIVMQIRGSGNSLQSITKTATAGSWMKIVATFDRVNNSHALYVGSTASPATSTYALGSQTLSSNITNIGGYYTSAFNNNTTTAQYRKVVQFNRVLNSTELETLFNNL